MRLFMKILYHDEIIKLQYFFGNILKLIIFYISKTIGPSIFFEKDSQVEYHTFCRYYNFFTYYYYSI